MQLGLGDTRWSSPGMIIHIITRGTKGQPKLTLSLGAQRAL